MAQAFQDLAIYGTPCVPARALAACDRPPRPCRRLCSRNFGGDGILLTAERGRAMAVLQCSDVISVGRNRSRSSGLMLRAVRNLPL